MKTLEEIQKELNLDFIEYITKNPSEYLELLTDKDNQSSFSMMLLEPKYDEKIGISLDKIYEYIINHVKKIPPSQSIIKIIIKNLSLSPTIYDSQSWEPHRGLMMTYKYVYGKK